VAKSILEQVLTVVDHRCCQPVPPLHVISRFVTLANTINVLLSINYVTNAEIKRATFSHYRETEFQGHNLYLFLYP